MKNWGLFIRGGALVALLMACSWAQAVESEEQGVLEPLVKPAQPSKSADVTLVGRGSHAAEVTKDGQVKEVVPGKVNVGKPVVKVVIVPAKPAEKAVGDAGAEALEKEKDKAAAEALKQADLEEIKTLRDEQRMWFFDESGKVMTKEELDKRIEQGNISGIKAVDDDRNEWTPKSAKPSEANAPKN